MREENIIDLSSTPTEYELSSISPPVYYSKLAPIAQRLGIQPMDKPINGGLNILSQGKWYDVFDVLSVLVDKMDEVLNERRNDEF